MIGEMGNCRGRHDGVGARRQSHLPLMGRKRRRTAMRTSIPGFLEEFVPRVKRHLIALAAEWRRLEGLMGLSTEEKMPCRS